MGNDLPKACEAVRLATEEDDARPDNLSLDSERSELHKALQF